MSNRRSMLAGLLGLGGITAVAQGARNHEEAVFNSGLQLFFAQRDAVINFDVNTGIGDHIGTVEGAIVGTSIVNFQFIFTSASTIKFDNRTLITDLDGDQIIFSYIGTGKFNPPPVDTTSPLGNLLALGGPITATYKAIVTTGKYVFLQGRSFPVKSIATNAARPAPGYLGNVYLECYSDSVGVIASTIKNNSK